MKIRVSITLAATVLAAASTAHADAKSDLEGTLLYFAGDLGRDAWTKYDIDNARDPEKCRAAIATAKKRGMGDADVIEDAAFRIHPKSTVDNPNAINKKYRITVADASWICDEYEKAKTFQTSRVAIERAYEVYEWMQMVKPEENGGTSTVTVEPKACLTAIDGMLAAGKKGSDTIQIKGKSVTLEGAKKECAFFLEEATKWEGESKSLAKAKREEIEAKYKKAGIKGDRLELFAYYDMEWYLPGCSTSTDDPKKLKKAKKLFQWLTDSAGVITVRKYTFKGDKYKVSERVFYNPDSAYRWCK